MKILSCIPVCAIAFLDFAPGPLAAQTPAASPEVLALRTEVTELKTRLAEVEAKIADLSVIADTLRAALDAGCADLTECARHPCCPLPFASEPSR